MFKVGDIIKLKNRSKNQYAPQVSSQSFEIITDMGEFDVYDLYAIKEKINYTCTKYNIINDFELDIIMMRKIKLERLKNNKV
jgi:hypothetical protein